MSPGLVQACRCQQVKQSVSRQRELPQTAEELGRRWADAEGKGDTREQP
jgi:hypothetical protein